MRDNTCEIGMAAVKVEPERCKNVIKETKTVIGNENDCDK